MTLNDEEIRTALKTDIAPAEELNERIMSMASKKNQTSPTHRFAFATAICLLVVLTSGVVVNAATGGRLIKFILGEDSKTVVVSEYETEIKNEIINGEEYEAVYIDDGRYSMSHVLQEDIPSYNLSIVLEKDGKSSFINLSALLCTPEQQTSEDMYYSIRESFYNSVKSLASGNNGFFKDELIQKLRTTADQETEDYIRDALYDVVDDVENNRNMLIYDANLNDCLGLGTSSWICEDISEYEEGEYTLIVNSVYGKPEAFIVGSDDKGRHWSTTVYSKEKEAELRNQGIEIIDRR